MTCSTHSISGIYMSATTNSVSVELLVFNLTFLDYLDTAPFPKVNIAPPCLLQSQCVLCDLSTYHFSIPRFSTLRLSFRYFVPFKYFNTLFSFPQLSSSGNLTLVVRNATAV